MISRVLDESSVMRLRYSTVFLRRLILLWLLLRSDLISYCVGSRLLWLWCEGVHLTRYHLLLVRMWWSCCRMVGEVVNRHLMYLLLMMLLLYGFSL